MSQTSAAQGKSLALRVVGPTEREESLRQEMLSALPSVRAFARSLCGSADQAEDILQETVANALTHLHTFKPGTNMTAWLITIARNAFLNGYRKRARELAYKRDLTWTAARSVRPEQDGRAEHSKLMAMLLRLPAEQREALLLVGGSGLSHEDAAKTSGVAVGTIKSRVHRARLRLANMMHVERGDFGAANEPFAAVA